MSTMDNEPPVTPDATQPEQPSEGLNKVEQDPSSLIPETPNSETLIPEAAATPPAAPVDGMQPPAEGDASTDEIKPLVKRKTLSIIIHDAGVLRAAYMQFVRGGGLFIPTKKTFAMGEDTNLVIRLLDEEEPYRVTGKVVWITPAGANNKAGGIGVEFAEDKNGERLRSRIEVILGPYLKSTEGTHTM